MQTIGHDCLKARKTLKIGSKEYDYFSLEAAGKALGKDFSKLPHTLKVLVENMLRYEDDRTVTTEDVAAFAEWLVNKNSDREIAYRPARVLMQDFTGVPAVVDLAAMRDAMSKMGGNALKINPLSPVDLVIDHSVMVDYFGKPDSFTRNVDLEMARNQERYAFLRWGQKALDNFRVVPPGTGICHQVNLEYLAQVVWTADIDGRTVAYPDTLVGTDSHTTMVNGLAVLGWGVGGIEAEAAMLGQPVSMLIPEVIGMKLTGALKEGVTATDLVLTVTNMLRKKGVVGKFVEFYGPGLEHLVLADRATIANMAPEYGATCGYFPIDQETLKYLELSGRSAERIALVEAYAKAQGLWRTDVEPSFTDTLELDLSTVEPSLAGPKRPQDRVPLTQVPESFAKLAEEQKSALDAPRVKVRDFDIGHGDVMIAAITSCTNTSNPGVMLAAGLVAKKAAEKGLKAKPWVKTSLAPGSQVVSAYFAAAGLQEYLDAVGFNLVGYGCTTCIGNSGPLEDDVAQAITDNSLTVAAVLSGNRNFEGRVHPQVKANYLASPPLVVAYALAGKIGQDWEKEPIGMGKDGKPVFLKDIWPTSAEVQAVLASSVTAPLFKSKYADVFKGDTSWQQIRIAEGQTYAWDGDSTYVKNPPYFEGMQSQPGKIEDIKGARVLALFGDSITTDHISPAGNISKTSPAAAYLKANGVEPADYNSYGARRGNHEVMMRGTFANIRIKNEMLGGVEGGLTRHIPSGEQLPIYDAAMRYIADGTPLVIFAGKEYGTGSSRDWAAKGTKLLGIRAVVAESFERIHRSNLVGMGVLPLVFKEGTTRQTLGLKGDELITIDGLTSIKPRCDLNCIIQYADGRKETVPLLCRIDTLDELEYYKHGGILHFMVRNLMKAEQTKAA